MSTVPDKSNAIPTVAPTNSDALTRQISADLASVARVVKLEQLESGSLDVSGIVDYYNASDLAYRVLHSRAGAIHMALNYDGQFSREGYAGQAELVSRYIPADTSMTVLELASGGGYNSLNLAAEFPASNFLGIDLTPHHVKTSSFRARNQANVRFARGDFQDLELPDATFDLVFVVESLCHATDMEAALRQAYRVLKPGREFIVFDAFRTPAFDSLSAEIKRCARITEMSMAVGFPWKLPDWIRLAESVGFHTLVSNDLSNAIMPNLLRLQHLAHGFFRYRLLTSALARTLPKPIIHNAIAGLLMPQTVRAGAHTYRAIVLNKGLKVYVPGRP